MCILFKYRLNKIKPQAAEHQVPSLFFEKEGDNSWRLLNTSYRKQWIRSDHPHLLQLPDFKYSRLLLFRSQRNSLKYFEISVLRHIRFAELRKKINRTATFHKWIFILTPEVRYIFKILGKRGEILVFFTIFCYLLLGFQVKTGTRFSLRDKHLFEISEVRITRIDCIIYCVSTFFITKG